MEYSAEIVRMAEEATRAMSLLMDANVSGEQRAQINLSLDRLKEDPCSLQCALCLCSMSTDTARHLGFQILEHLVKYTWNEIELVNKVLIKDTVLRVMNAAECDMPSHVAEALCRPMVEIVKREWPQQYADFVPDMAALAARGSLHTELSLRILLRLAEDVVTFQTMPSGQRRRELLQTLVSHSSAIFHTLLSTLSQCGESVRDRESGGRERRLSRLCLATLCCYVEWTDVQIVLGNEGQLLRQLLNLLVLDDRRSNLDEDKDIYLLAAECLCNMFSRSGKLDDRATMLLLLQPACVQALKVVFNGWLLLPPSDTALGVLRLLAQSCSAAVNQLCTCYGRDNGKTKLPDGLVLFLQLMLQLNLHTSCSPTVYVLSSWLQLLRHPQLLRTRALLDMVPSLMHVAVERCEWPLAPSSSHSGGDPHQWMSLEGEQSAVSALIAQMRSDSANLVRLCSEADPRYALAHIRSCLSPLYSAVGGSVSLVDWQRAVFLTENATKRIVAAAVDPDNAACLRQEGAALLDLILAWRPPLHANTRCGLLVATELFNHHVSVLSALAVFLSAEDQPQQLSSLLDALFSAVTWPLCLTPALCTCDGVTCRDPVRQLRQHGCHALSALAIRSAAALWRHFELLQHKVRDIVALGSCGLQERVSLCELLLSVHGHGGSWQQHEQLLTELLQPWKELVPELVPVVASVTEFVSATGLHRIPEQLGCDDDVSAHRVRSKLNALVTLVNSVLLRSKRADFASPSATENAYSPCLLHVAAFLPLLFQLLRVFHTLHATATSTPPAGTSAVVAVLLRVPDSVRDALVFGSSASPHLSPPHRCQQQGGSKRRLQSWLMHVHELALVVVKNTVQVLRPWIFQISPPLGDLFSAGLLCELARLPDFWLRQQVRSVWRPVVYLCPAEQRSEFLLPLLSVLVPHLVERLDARFKELLADLNSDPNDDRQQDLEAVFNTQVISQLASESIQLLKNLLLPSPTSPDTLPPDSGRSDNGMDMNPAPVCRTETGVSKLGSQALMHSQNLGNAILALLFRAVGWRDSSACLQSCNILSSVISFVSERLMLESQVCDMFYSVLHGFEVHGHIACNCAALLNCAVVFYYNFLPRYPQLDTILAAIPGVNSADIDRMRDKIFNHPKISQNIKLKKDVFKKIISPLIGCSVNEMFSRKVAIRDLIPLVKPAKSDVDPVTSNDSNISSLTLLFSAD